MENISPKYQAWLQSAKEYSSFLNIYTIVAATAILCITTRILSDIRSRPKEYGPGQARDVRKLPYWFPYIGHAISLGIGSLKFLQGARKSLDDDLVISLHMGGKTHNLVTTPSLMQSLFLQRTAASQEPFVRYIIVAVFGCGREVAGMEYTKLKSIHGALNHLVREPYLSNMVSSMVRTIEQEIPNLVSFSPSLIDQSMWERVSQVDVSDSNPNVCEANLFSLVRNFVGSMATRTLMGRAFADLYPNILQDLWIFDSQFNLLLLGVPPWFPLPRVSAAYAARARLSRAVSSFHAAFAATEAGQNPGFDWQDMEDVSDVMKARSREWTKSGLPPKLTGPGDMSVLWAMNVNANNTVFWLFLQILSNPDLLAEVLEEIAPFAKAERPAPSGFPIPEPPTLSIDIDGLHNSCPMLKAAYYESLRLHSSAFSYKEAVTDFTLTESNEDAALRNQKAQTYNIRTGEYAAIAHGMHHLDPLYFPNPEKFDPRRFLVKDEEKSSEKAADTSADGKKSNITTHGYKADMRTIRPFGGGSTVCKGRLFAEREILAFAAGMLAMWDVQPADGKPWKIPGRSPASAVALPDKEVRVKMKLRV